MTLKQILTRMDRVMGVRFEDQKIICDNEDCVAYGRKPICYMKEEYEDCKKYRPNPNSRRSFIE